MLEGVRLGVSSAGVRWVEESKVVRRHRGVSWVMSVRLLRNCGKGVVASVKNATCFKLVKMRIQQRTELCSDIAKHSQPAEQQTRYEPADASMTR